MGYVLVGGNNGYEDGIWKLNPEDLTLSARSPFVNSPIMNILAYGRYVYSQSLDGKIWKFNLSDMTKEKESLGAYAEVTCIIGLGEYLIFGTTQGIVNKLDIKDLSFNKHLALECTQIEDVATDGEYIYALLLLHIMSDYSWKLVKIDPSDMSVIMESNYQSGYILRIICLGDYIYSADGANVQKFSKVTLSQVGSASSLYARDIATDGEYIYTCGAYTIRKYNTGLSLLAESADDDGTEYLSLATDGDYVYSGGFAARNPFSPPRVTKFSCLDLSKKAFSDYYPGFIWAVEVSPEEVVGEVKTIGAYRNTALVYMELTGEITAGDKIFERGFEFAILNEEPEEDGIKITEKSITPFEIGEYTLNDYAVMRGSPLYNLEDNTIFWFRAIIYVEEVKYVGEWMKNVPTVITGGMSNQLVLNAIPVIEAHGELTDKGANEVTERGFRIIKEYQGDLFGADFYIAIAFGNFKVMEELESHTILGGADGYTVIDYYWTGTFYRDSIEKGNFDLGEFVKELGGGMSFEGFGLYLKQDDTYLIQAIAKNNLGWGFGELKSITTLSGTTIGVTDNKLDSTKFEKTVTLGTIPSGCQVTRIGVRLGRTKGCNELHYFKDGSWGSGGSVTFMVELEPNSTYYMMPYIVINYGDYEEEILGMLSYTDPNKEEEYLEKYPVEITEDIEDDKLTTSAQAGQGNYSYRSINKEITCEKIGYQGLIDYYGRRRAYTVNNHLIQKKDVCCLVISNYLDNFQRLKLKVAIDVDMPIPFQEQDTILLGDGKILFKVNTQGIILFKADGEGELQQQSFILAKIRKLGATFTSGGSTIIPMELEV